MQEKPCKAILVDPFACTVMVVDYGGELEHVYKLLSHESMPVDCMEAGRVEWLDGRDVAMIDEDGIAKYADRWVYFRDHLQPFAGKALVMGADLDGNTISPETSLEKIAASVLFLRRHQSGDICCLRETTTPWTETIEGQPMPWCEHCQCYHHDTADHINRLVTE